MTKAIKPPIGLTPIHVHNGDRVVKILEAMMRYAEVRKQVPKEWLDELARLNSWTQK